jgi:arsenate reductase (thioredoxin)
MTVTLTPEEKFLVRHAAVRLRRQFEGQLNAETIERFLSDSVDALTSRAKSTMWIPLLAERFAKDRLRALVRLEVLSTVKPRNQQVGGKNLDLESGVTDLNPSVLFLCVHNAGRSQMAAGWMRHLAGDRVEVFSGGSEPAEEVNKVAVEAMAEKDIDISGEVPQPWADEIVRAADVVVTMGCGDACPVFPGKLYLDWELDDPSGQPIEVVRRIRDDLESRVRVLLDELTLS